MHLLVREQLEEVLAGRPSQECLTHLAECPECCTAVALMRGDAAAMRSLRVDAEPRAGFYARVMERIEERGSSVWSLFFDSIYGRRILTASVALALLMGVYIWTTESDADETLASQPSAQNTPEAQLAAFPANIQEGDFAIPSMTLPAGLPDQNGVLEQIVTYQVQIVEESGPAPSGAVQSLPAQVEQ